MRRFLLFISILIFSASLCYGQSYTGIVSVDTVWADSREEPSVAAVDGNQESYWQSSSTVGDHWLVIDLGRTFNMDRIVTPRFTGIDSLVVEVWKDNSWNVVATRTPAMSGGDSPDNPLVGFPPEQTNRIRLRSVNGAQMRMYEVQVFEHNPLPVFVNQSGYNLKGPKRFTAPLAPDGRRFTI
ncbi:MAG TPA: discoidin domain-containing protein, partial [Fodinibius sp.]|nr:discoidin domain-containing protein [Fodinibius sp.]